MPLIRIFRFSRQGAAITLKRLFIGYLPICLVDGEIWYEMLQRNPANLTT